MDVGVEQRQSYRLPVGNEVDFVAALRKPEAELGGDNAASAKGRVTDDGYFHRLWFGLRMYEITAWLYSGITVLR
jgi:hypothetical protein